jgi:mRNA interferase HigB
MRIISKKALQAFWLLHPSAKEPLLAWHTIISKTSFEHFAHLKQTFGSADWVKPFVVFDIAGNHFRLICVIHFNRQTVYVRHVFTHLEYDQWKPKKGAK